MIFRDMCNIGEKAKKKKKQKRKIRMKKSKNEKIGKNINDDIEMNAKLGK